MAANDISELVKLADSLVYENKAEHLTQRQKDILRQTLQGKKNSAIWFPSLKNSYVKSHLIPELWELLAEVVGEEVNKRNVFTVLQKIQQLRQSETASRSKALTNTQVELNGHVASNGSVSWLANRFSTSTTDAVKSNKEFHQFRVLVGTNPNYTARPHPNHLHSSGVRGSRLLNNGQLRVSLDTEFAQNKKPDSLPNSNTQELQLSLRTVLPEDEEASSSTFCGPNYMNFRSGAALLISIGVIGSMFALSWAINWFGVRKHLAGDLPAAQESYKWSTKLNPLSPAAHYNQGVAYEDQQNYARAHAEYQLAIEGGLIAAYNNQARLYILEENEDAAVSLLKTGLPLAKEPRVKADMYKNLGWARLKQGRLDEAKLDLTQAIKRKSDRAPAYCLLAQVLEREGDKQGALVAWRDCLGFNTQKTPEEDKWYHLARQRLEAQGGIK